jgi:hypothetical protein
MKHWTRRNVCFREMNFILSSRCIFSHYTWTMHVLPTLTLTFIGIDLNLGKTQSNGIFVPEFKFSFQEKNLKHQSTKYVKI